MNNPLSGETESEEERSSPSKARCVAQIIDKGASGIPHPSTPPPPLTLCHTPTPPPPLFNMENRVKMSVFRGQSLEDPEQFWFVIEVVWKSQQINDDDMKKSQLVTMLQDRMLT